MLGFLMTLFFGLGILLLARWAFRTWLEKLHPLEGLGIAGLAGLGLAGTLTFLIGLIPAGLRIVLPLLCLLSVLGFLLGYRSLRSLRLSVASTTLFVLLLFLTITLVSAVTPSDMMDWDSLAYHLAVPKIWLMQGQITYVPTIHHSNFPFTVDSLYLLGLQWGGASGAKSFTVLFYCFGATAVYGMLHRLKSQLAALWGTLAFLSVPVVLWETGTAYIDVAHGLFAGFGLVYVLEFSQKVEDKSRLYLASTLIGLAMASKLTGIQTLFIAFGGCVVLLWRHKQLAGQAKFVAFAGSLCLVLVLPYLIRNLINTGNPVFPFFDGVFHSPQWSHWRAQVYANEQASFGIGVASGSKDWGALGAAILGLAYQPGRYVNPGQMQGLGYPQGAIGIAVLALPIFAALQGRMSRLEKNILGCFSVSLVLWFALSQQSRYLISWIIPLLVLIPDREPKSAVLVARSLIASQAIYSLLVLTTLFPTPANSLFSGKLRVVLGQVTPEAYQRQKVSFYTAARALNEDALVTKVALYDVVFGFFLDKPYIWANPAHSTLLGEPSPDPKRLLIALRTQECSHIAVQLQLDGSTPTQEFVDEITGQKPEACSDKTLAAFETDVQICWKSNLIRAVRSSDIELIGVVGRTVILRIQSK